MTSQQHLPAWVFDLAAAAVVIIGGGILFGLGLGLGGLGGPFDMPAPVSLGPVPLTPGGQPALTPHIVGAGLVPHIVGAVLTEISAVLMFLRRSWPTIVFVVTLVCVAITAGFSAPSLGPGIAATIAAYTLADRRSRKLAFLLAGGAGIVMMVLSSFDLGPVFFDMRIGAALIIAAALGDSAQSRRAYLAAAEERALRAEQSRETEARRRVSEERLRIARDLHDTVAHQLSVINLHAGMVTRIVDTQPERAREALGTIRQAAREGIGEIGELLRFLRKDEVVGVDEPGVAPPSQGTSEILPLLARMRESGFAIDAEIDPIIDVIPDALGSTVFRIVQEGLTNARKHGGGSAHLRIFRSVDELCIDLRNPFRAAEEVATVEDLPSTKLGLVGIRERAALAHGSVRSGPFEQEYRLEVRIPLPIESIDPSTEETA